MSLEHSPQRQRGALSVAKFCEAHDLSIPFFYKLKAKGEGPDTFKAGSRTLISDEAAARWRRARERAARNLRKQPKK
jgi:hypothetical protein